QRLHGQFYCKFNNIALNLNSRVLKFTCSRLNSLKFLAPPHLFFFLPIPLYVQFRFFIPVHSINDSHRKTKYCHIKDAKFQLTFQCMALKRSQFPILADHMQTTIHKVIRAFPKTKADIDFLNSLEENPDIEVDFWARSRDIDIHVGPEDYQKLDSYLRRWNINYNIMNNNLQKSFEEEEKGHYRHSHGWHGTYRNYDEIMQKLNNFNNSLNTGRTKVVNIGNSYEKRNILGLEISDGKGQAGKQKIVVICGQHAREWVSPATCMYIMDNMISKYGKDHNITGMLDRFNWVFFPTVNPDGYVYTWEKDRMWRKNRQPNKKLSCHGTDLNRNWDYHFAGAGSSNNPCNDIYHGERAFSAPEVLALANYIKSLRGEIYSFIDLHSYSQLLMFPWSYSKKAEAKDKAELYEISVKAVDALRSVHGTVFKTGPAAVVIYEASGSAKDWVYGSMGVKYAFVFELRDRGKHGFVLPKEQIIPTADETFAALHSLSINMKDYGNKKTSY
ncbi:carboxypeptidase B-like, partial [Paramuricea clavata]